MPASSVARARDGLSEHAQLEIQAESKFSIANEWPVLEAKPVSMTDSQSDRSFNA